MLSVLSLCGPGARAEEAAPAPEAPHLDSLLLTNGEVLRGTIVSTEQGVVVIDLRGGERRTLQPGEVRSLNRWRPPLVASGSRAPARRADEPRGPPMQWYGWQIMLSDLAAAGTAALTKPLPYTNESAILGLAGAIYLIGPVVLHTLNGRPGRAVGSLALRLGLGLGASFYVLTEHPSLFGAVVVGGVAPLLIDWTLLPYRPDEPERPAAPPATLGFAPTRNGLVLAGRF